MSSESLPQFVASEARNANDRTLSGSGGIGLLVVAGVLWWRPPAWPVFTAIGVMLIAIAGWGLADHRLAAYATEGTSHDVARPLLILARDAAALIGWVAMLLALFALMGVALGTIIS